MRNLDVRRHSNHSQWIGKDSKISRHVKAVSTQCLNAYRANAKLVSEHANIEIATAQGGYGRRQVYELVQNGADALIGHENGRIHIILTDAALYCANQGDPVTPEGIDAIMHSHLSRKRGAEIGRFGLGFKSVLGVTNCPEFYSQTGSFGFDADYSVEKIRTIVPMAERFPILRLASSLDAAKAAKVDDCLNQAMGWASTVIKLPRSSWKSDWLSEDVRNFPAEFLLFSPHVGELTLEDRTSNHNRTIRLQKGGEGLHTDSIALSVGDKTTLWKVFVTQHKPTKSARETAGELSDRESLPLMWAVPMGGRQERGKFWAFFPTEYYTTLSGIVNAPWKTNEDRQNLLTGVFNEELIQAAAQLIAQNLERVVAADDPGRFLELLPARGREAPNWADEKITEATYDHVSKVPCIPDQDGTLRRVAEIRLHPDGLPPEALQAWASYPARPCNWCHHSVQPTSRRSRVERLFGLAGQGAESIVQWLEALVKDRTPEASLAAVQAAAAITMVAVPLVAAQVRQARIVLTESGRFMRADPSVVFIARDDAGFEADVETVHRTISDSSVARKALETLGINEVDASSELQAMIAQTGLQTLNRKDWTSFWGLIRRLSVEAALQLIGDKKSLVHVRTVSGDYLPLGRTLLPGPIVPEDGSRDQVITIDTAFHAKEMAVIHELGAVDGPKSTGGSTEEEWFSEFRTAVVRQYLDKLPRTLRPQENKLIFPQRPMVGPLNVLSELTDEGNARFTEGMFAVGVDDQNWVICHESRSDIYPSLEIESPYVWIARRKGRLRTSLGIYPARECVASSLAAWSTVLPVAECGQDISDKLKLPCSLEELTASHWARAFAVVQEIDDDVTAGAFYAAACRVVPASDLQIARLRCRVGDRTELRGRAMVTAISDLSLVEPLVALRTPFLRVPSDDDADTLVSRWGLVPADQFVSREIKTVSSGSQTPLTDRYGGLSFLLRDDQRNLRLVPCSSLRLETVTAAGTQAEERSIIRDGDIIYHYDHLDDAALLDILTDELHLRLDEDQRDALLENRTSEDLHKKLAAIRVIPTLRGRLLAAVGAEALPRRLPSGLIAVAQAIHGAFDDEQMAACALATFGLEALQIFRDELHRKDLQPPAQWAGSYAARKFVADLGFPKEYAGFREGRRDAVLDVEGPPNLPQLHDFQEQIVAQIRDLLEAQGDRRALVSLPTGAGKTRVAVEAMVRAVRDDKHRGPILWIAQKDELCEQAVQAWSEVWRSLGPREPLRINRLWASNEADLFEESTQVVVATIDKLQGCINDAEYAWLREATCVIIDEAHESTTKEYTAALEWLGLQRQAERCPLIGLTATPFRGSEEETKRLVYRFNRRLDFGVLGDDPYGMLQDMGVLAQVDHEVMAGATLSLSEAELNELRRMRRLPRTAETRLGTDVGRNKMLLDSIRARPQAWPILVFATSVEQARTMAALLSMEGTTAAAISGETDPAARRHYIEQFRTGSLRVLTNYGVLTTGFDAPSVRAIYVARPTYSPVLYQQMIGRGLRGPKNGGKERCLIVNVEDNIVQYGEKLAFHDFDYLWSSPSEVQAAV